MWYCEHVPRISEQYLCLVLDEDGRDKYVIGTYDHDTKTWKDDNGNLLTVEYWTLLPAKPTHSEKIWAIMDA